MCGIAGFYAPGAADPRTLERMTAALAHRGPDASGFHVEGPVHLGHRRLSVIDIAGSPQPMRDAEGRVAVTYNGEIYNFRELREDLARQGWRFRTNGDTEVLIAAWHRYGERMVTHLRGMFAFALWDARDERLFLARDHIGVKPLYYAWDGTTLVFASEAKAVLEHPSVARDIDLAALRLYLEAQFVPAPHSILQSVRKLPPAHTLSLSRGALSLARYWSPSYTPKEKVDDTTAMDIVERELRASIEGMLIADVPIGAFLSGGIDSRAWWRRS